ncbi:MAG: DUF72 domain-containing protein [Planctomycetota bacterium]
MIRVGTAGFSYKDWEGRVYPAPKPREFDPLAYLADYFDCVEMNVTFYRVPTPEMVQGWLSRVSDRPEFRFAFKLYRGLTHDTEDDALPGYLDAIAPARDAGRLGAILLQFPFWFRNTAANRARLAHLAGQLRGWPCALEVRDKSWLIEPALDFFRRQRLNFVDIDLPQARESVPPGEWTTGSLGYVRLHGRNSRAWFDKTAHRDQKYDYLYSAPELEEWCGRIRSIAESTDSVYVVTNNHYGGQAVANAFELSRRLGLETPAPPEVLTQAFPRLA